MPPLSEKPWLKHAYDVLWYFITVGMYTLPLLTPHAGRPVLDEIHLENADITGNYKDYQSLLHQIFTNDYWGRPMNNPSSHKSWRPLSVLFFRWLGTSRWPNVMIHAALSHLVGVLATKLIPTRHPRLLRRISQLVFSMHPTHVEVTANAANRPHLLALLCSVMLGDPHLNFFLFIPLLVAGFLCAETFIFQTLPCMATLVAIRYRRSSTFGQCLYACRFRLALILSAAFGYYAMRFALDWLDIPDDLIRPAENPFYRFAGLHRVRNYLYILSVHVAKAWDVDFVGPSHEYGHECIAPLTKWMDARLLIPLAIGVLYASITSLIFLYSHNKTTRSLWVVHVAWMATLFPVSGVIKVGTFVADRIVVASTVSTSTFVSLVLFQWLRPPRRPGRYAVVGLVALILYLRLYWRATEWLDFYPLLLSSIKTCPRFAKAHLELSKIHSGLYPQKLNLTTSRRYVEFAAKHDPTFCDVHWQYAQINLQEGRFMEFEEELTQALLCPFTLGSAKPLWDRYWQAAGNSARPEIAEAAKRRQEKFVGIIQKALAEEEAKSAGERTVGWQRG